MLRQEHFLFDERNNPQTLNSAKKIKSTHHKADRLTWRILRGRSE